MSGYVSPYLQKPMRTLEQARKDIEKAKEQGK